MQSRRPRRTGICHIFTVVATCVAHGINPRAYLDLVTKLLVDRWLQAKLRVLLPDRLAVTHPEIVVRDGPFRSSVLLGPEDPVPTRAEAQAPS
jgi:hypothetical protein